MFGWGRKKIAVLEGVEAAELLKKLAAMERKVADLEDNFQALDARYDKLRARFYNTQRGKGDEDAPPTSRADLKAQLARSGRFIPGRPAVHQE